MRFINDDFVSTEQKRTAVKISLEDFKEKFIKYIYECLDSDNGIYNDYSFYLKRLDSYLKKEDIKDSDIVQAFYSVFSFMQNNMLAGKDIEKFNFDSENVYLVDGLGITTLSNGLVCICLEVGGRLGDWCFYYILL